MKKKYLNKIVKICIILLLAFHIISCKGEDNETEETVKTEPAAAKVKKPEGGSVSGGGTSVPEAVVSQPEGKDFLLYSEAFQDAVFPEDYEIGPLQSTDDAGAADVLGVTEQFLKGLVAGDIEEKLISTRKKDFVIRVLARNLEKAAPKEYRIGIIQYLDDPAWADIRLFGTEGSAEGTIYFVRENGWKIYDMHLDFSDIESPPKAAEGEYDPVKNEKM